MPSRFLISQAVQERTKFLCHVMCEITGQNVLSESKIRSVAIPRMMVMYQLRLEGISGSDVARLLGKNHSTVIYSAKRVNDMLTTPGYNAEREIWKEFQSKI